MYFPISGGLLIAKQISKRVHSHISSFPKPIFNYLTLDVLKWKITTSNPELLALFVFAANTDSKDDVFMGNSVTINKFGTISTALLFERHEIKFQKMYERCVSARRRQ